MFVSKLNIVQVSIAVSITNSFLRWINIFCRYSNRTDSTHTFCTAAREHIGRNRKFVQSLCYFIQSSAELSWMTDTDSHNMSIDGLPTDQPVYSTLSLDESVWQSVYVCARCCGVILPFLSMARIMLAIVFGNHIITHRNDGSDWRFVWF